MNEESRRYSRGHHEGMLSAVSVGFFLILIGILFMSTPNLVDKLNTFFSHFQTTQVAIALKGSVRLAFAVSCMAVERRVASVNSLEADILSI